MTISILFYLNMSPSELKKLIPFSVRSQLKPLNIRCSKLSKQNSQTAMFGQFGASKSNRLKSYFTKESNLFTVLPLKVYLKMIKNIVTHRLENSKKKLWNVFLWQLFCNGCLYRLQILHHINYIQLQLFAEFDRCFFFYFLVMEFHRYNPNRQIND